jgi:hypothetical protein
MHVDLTVEHPLLGDLILNIGSHVAIICQNVKVVIVWKKGGN